MSRLVKFRVIWDVLFRNQSQNLAVLEDSGDIVQAVVYHKRQAYQDQCINTFGSLADLTETLQTAAKQCVLQEKFSTGVATQAQLREDDQSGSEVCSRLKLGYDLLCIICHIGHPDLRGDSGNFEKSIFHRVTLHFYIIDLYRIISIYQRLQ